ncbi:FAD-dependent pyridine nucleotide-disulfide oxidoreductase [Penicillium odoratum]|uniref:FAD-dependent pyridine nucleotide-disulfide oxidoreductase n=1 Tax=Penicillium odoratum TaxID=1167516 RepID=UPI002549247F|nr:FAD-dependent pyridine nucleotide-disulfide oxidoreductase [Penicillium odoratum]KAJ5752928.1 FAD-dependent pyridine nucleotide-disulfide oxidoreductase [Penicillium odoratum]
MRSQKVAIIGAGPSGLVTAKTLLHNFPHGTFSPTIFESRHEVGGLWPNRPSGTGTLDPSMRTNLSRFTVAFSDFSWESALGTSNIPMFPQASQVGQYLDEYTNRYIPSDVLRLGHRVLKAERIASETRWRIQWRKERFDGKVLSDEIESEEFDLLVVASGYFAHKHIPTIPGLEQLQHAGRVVHSSDLQSQEGLRHDHNTLARGNVAVIGGSMSGVEAASAVALHQSSSAQRNTKDDKHIVYHIHSRPFWTLPTHLPHETEETVSFLPLDLSMYDLGRRPPGPIEYALGVIPEENAAKTNEYFSSLLGAEYEKFGYMQGSSPSQSMSTRPSWVAIGNDYAEFVRSKAIKPTMGRAVSMQTNPDTKMATIEIISADGQSESLENIAAVVVATGFTPFKSLSLLPTDVLSALEYSTEDPFLPVILDKGSTVRSEIPNLGFVGFYRGPYWGIMEMQARFLGAEWMLEIHQSEKTEAQREILRILRDPGVNSQRGQFPMGDYVGLMESFTKDLGICRTALSESDSRSGPAIPARYPYNHSATSREDLDEEKKRTLDALKDLSDPSHPSLQAAAALAIFRSLQGAWKFSQERGSEKESGTIIFTPRYASNPDYDREYVCSILDSDSTDKVSLPSTSRSIFRLSESGACDGTQIEVWTGDIPVNETDGNPQQLHLTPFYRKQVGKKYIPGEYVIYAKGYSRASGEDPAAVDIAPSMCEYIFHFKGVSIITWERVESKNSHVGSKDQPVHIRTVYKR